MIAPRSVLISVAFACGSSNPPPPRPVVDSPPVVAAPIVDAAPPPPPPPGPAAAVAHGGVGADGDLDGVRRAVDEALRVLDAGGDPLDAAVAGVAVMEDDPRYNAGTGSVVRIDGATVQMDASVMRSDGRFAAVAAIEHVKNPVRVARAVLDTPHVLLVGDGATRFARTLGMPSYDPATPEMKAYARSNQQALLANSPGLPAAWQTFDWRKHWNFERSIAKSGLGGGSSPKRRVTPGADTVGVVARSADGRFAAALSTGGTSITLRGRVGDVPIFGAGLFASPAGGSAATGTGERIIEAALARQIDEWLRAGATADEAARRAVELVNARGGDVGVIVMTPNAIAGAADAPMDWAGRESGSTRWYGSVTTE
jgi:isoaspartyl peptidase/L-asparaginase-like protein (Ntn-hydrolase superfamily)